MSEKLLKSRKDYFYKWSCCSLEEQVKCPSLEDESEWLAMNVIYFFNKITLILGFLTDFCTCESCPVMSAGPRYEYLWLDRQLSRKSISCSAPCYTAYLMDWVREQVNETLFPPVADKHSFPKNFLSIIRLIFKRLFRIYAHIYHHHAQELMELGVEAQLNTEFRHFYLFISEFDLVEDRELHPLHNLIDIIHAERERQENEARERSQTVVLCLREGDLAVPIPILHLLGDEIQKAK